jgi:hypothetical protein
MPGARSTLCSREGDRSSCAADARLRLIAALECHASALVAGAAAVLDVDRLDLLLEFYDCRADEIADHVLPQFVADHERLLADLFHAYRYDARAATLLAPEVLLIFERLERDPDRLRDLWQRRRSLDELEELASVYGLPI